MSEDLELNAKESLEKMSWELAELAGSMLEASKTDDRIEAWRREVVRIMRTKNKAVALPPLFHVVIAGAIKVIFANDDFYMDVPEGPDQEMWIEVALGALNHARVTVERQRKIMAASPRRNG